MTDSSKIVLNGKVEAFGFPVKEARIEALERSRSWRATRGLLSLAIGLGVTPVVALVPPHFPWALGALGTGAVLAQRRMTEHYTLLTMDATCPRCGAALSTPAGRLTGQRTLTCPSCNQEVLLEVKLP